MLMNTTHRTHSLPPCLTATQWDSELEESESEDSDIDSDSSEDDFFDD